MYYIHVSHTEGKPIALTERWPTVQVSQVILQGDIWVSVTVCI